VTVGPGGVGTSAEGGLVDFKSGDIPLGKIDGSPVTCGSQLSFGSAAGDVAIDANAMKLGAVGRLTAASGGWRLGWRDNEVRLDFGWQVAAGAQVGKSE